MTDEVFKNAISSQYFAGLEKMTRLVMACPEELWLSNTNPNPIWRLCYHTLFFFRMYLNQNLEEHIPWIHHIEDANNMGIVLDSEPYSKDQMLEFITHCKNLIAPSLNKMDINADDSGFPWYDVNKAEHTIINLRHLQHHVGQIQDRMRNTHDIRVPWIRDQNHNPE